LGERGSDGLASALDHVLPQESQAVDVEVDRLGDLVAVRQEDR
jgi:hypothetical protein